MQQILVWIQSITRNNLSACEGKAVYSYHQVEVLPAAALHRHHMMTLDIDKLNLKIYKMQKGDNHKHLTILSNNAGKSITGAWEYYFSKKN